MWNNFEVGQCTLLSKLISLSLPFFQNVGQVIIMEWMLIVIVKYGEGGGRGGRTSVLQLKFYFDACLWFISMFLSFSFCLLGCLFPSSSPLKGTTLVWTEYRITCLFVCWHLYVQHRSFLRSFLRQRRYIFKCHCSKPTSLSYGNKFFFFKWCYN